MTAKPNLTRVWAAGAPGGNVVDPDTTTPGKFDAGWLAEVPPFEHFNFLQQLFTQGLAHANEEGIMTWDTDTTYPIGGLAKGSDTAIYKAVISQNGNDPVSDGGVNWVDIQLGKYIRKSTVADMTATAGVIVGNTLIETDEFFAGTGGGALYTPIAGTGTANGKTIIAHDTDDISFVFTIVNNSINVNQTGAVADGTAQNSSLQAAFDLADTVSIQGGLRIDIPGGADHYGIDGTIDMRIKSNTRLVWTGGSFLKLLSASFGGGVIGTLKDSVNIEIHNPLIDGNNIFAGGSGQNGLGLVSRGVRVYGGNIKNCARGNVSPFEGGKGIQSEGGNIIAKVFGTTLENCHIGASARRDFITDPDPSIDVVWDSCTYISCNHAWFVGMNNINDLDADEQSVKVPNFTIINSGTADAVGEFDAGAIVLDRANNVIADGTISGTVTLEGIIRGRHRNCKFEIKVDQSADGLINIDPTVMGADTNVTTGNTYTLNATGTYDYLALSDLTDATHPNRVINNSDLDIKLVNDVNIAIVTPATRNGNARLKVKLSDKVIEGDAADFNSKVTNMAGVASGKSIEDMALIRFDTGNVAWQVGAGTPEGAVTAPIGSLFTRTDGGASTTLYVKESGAGNTGWVAK